MKIKSLVQTVALSAVASLMLIGCGGGSDSTPVDTTQTGTFVDAPVKGLRYITATQNGYTNDSGEFSYKSGETVEFRLGNLSLGTVTAGELITPYTIAGDTNISDPSDKATNIAMLLQSFDGNRSNTAMLDVSKLQDANLSDINISATVSDMTTKIANKFADNGFSQYRDTTNNTPVDATTAKNSMKAYVGENSVKFDKKFTEEYLQQLGNHYVVLRDWDDEDNVPLGYVGITHKFANGHTYQTQNLVNLSTTLSLINTTYTIEDGKLKQTDSSGTWTSVILEVTDDYLLGCDLDAGETVCQEQAKFYLFKDQTKAQAKIDEMNIALLNSTKKFTTGYLNDKTFYMVVKWDTMVRTDDTFNSNGTLAHTNTPDGNFNESWSITSDGKIQVTSGGETFYLTIVSATADYIEVQSNTVNNSGRMYFDQTKANTYKNSL
ncbi:MAG: hypothetical protein RBT59_08535 [Arcobacteraceae bacterium]|jgi:hypothetical protein|nr:hypothetical protein [Arcobacteraceae bacterium]